MEPQQRTRGRTQAPEAKFPAPIEDAVAAVRWLRSTYPGAAGPSAASSVFLLGDSSGGGVAISAALACKRDGVQLDGCCAICPATDYTFSSESYATRMWDAGTMTGDPVFTESEAFDRFGLAPGPEQVRIDREQRQEYTANYLGDVPMDDPLTSPAYASVGDFVGVCPLLFLSADEDVSLDDAVRCAKIAQQAGCSVDLVVWPRVWCAPTTSFHSGSSISCRGWWGQARLDLVYGGLRGRGRQAAAGGRGGVAAARGVHGEARVGRQGFALTMQPGGASGAVPTGRPPCGAATQPWGHGRRRRNTQPQRARVVLLFANFLQYTSRFYSIAF